MPKLSKEKIIIACCICCIVITLILKSSIYKITNPQHYQAASLAPPKQHNSEEIIVHFHDRRPFNMAYKDEARGLVATPLNLAFAYAGIPFHWQVTPAARQLDIIRHNLDRSCAAGWFKTSEREEFGRYSFPIYQDRPFVAITRSDNTLLDETENLDRAFNERRLQVLVKAGYSYGSYIDERLRELKPRQVSTTADNQSLLKMILSSRADYCFMTEEEAQDQLLFSGLQRSDFKLVYFSDMPKGDKRYLICSKMVDEDILNRLNQAIGQIVNIRDNNE